MGINGCLPRIGLVATVIVVASCSSHGQGPAVGRSDADPAASGASYLALLDEGMWPEAWQLLTDHRRSFWDGLARAVAGGCETDFPDLVVRSVRARLGVHTASTEGYDLFRQLCRDVETYRVPRILVREGFRSKVATRDGGIDIARVQVKEHGIDMRLRFEVGAWRVDSVALMDESSDVGIESPGEDYEIFFNKLVTVRHPRVDVEALGLKTRVSSGWLQVDGSGSVYWGRTFVPKSSLAGFASWMARSAPTVKVVDDPMTSFFRVDISADTMWGEVSLILAGMYAGGCRELVLVVEPLTGPDRWGLPIRLEGAGGLVLSRLLRREHLVSADFSSGDLARVARQVAEQTSSPWAGVVEVSISGNSCWEDALAAIVAVGKETRTPLFLSVEEQCEGGGGRFSIHEIHLTGTHGEPARAREVWLPVRVALLRWSH